MRGSYALLMHLGKEEDMGIGSMGILHFPKGYYIYVGSAMNGIESRVRRHLRGQKKLHWHIDYFLKKAKVETVYLLETEERMECSLAERFGKISAVMPKFGSSDCHCMGHLFYGARLELVGCAMESGMKERRPRLI